MAIKTPAPTSNSSTVVCTKWSNWSKGFRSHLTLKTSRVRSPSVMTASQQTNELDALLDLESTFENEGRAEAARVGTKAGDVDGFDLGWKSGASLSAELEFMHGAAATLLALSTKHPTLVPTRALAYANDLVSKSRPPLAARGNDERLDMESHTSEMRSIFRRMVALAGLPTVKYQVQGSRLADLSF